MLSATSKAASSGKIEIPPRKLNPFNSGYSTDIGIPAAKKAISGKPITMPMVVSNMGDCSPVSCCFLCDRMAYMMDSTTAKANAANIQPEPSLNTGPAR